MATKAARILRPASVRTGDVLDVRLGGREPPCRGRGERERGVDAFGDGVDEAGQRIGIGGFELGELTPFEDLAGEFMALVSEFLEDLGASGPCAGGGFLGAGQAHFAEEEIAELFGRAEIEGLAGQRVDIMFEAGHGLGEFAREAGEDLPVDRDAALLHAGEDGDERALERLVDGEHVFGDEAGFQCAPEAEGDVGIFGGVISGLVEGDAGKADEILAGAGDFGKRDGLVTEMALGERIHAVRAATGIEHIGDQHRVVQGGDGNAVTGENEPVIFHVLTNFENGGIFQQGFEAREDLREGQLAGEQGRAAEKIARALAAMAERDIARFARRSGERNADEIGLHRIERGGVGIDGEGADVAGAGDDLIELLKGGDALIAGGVDFGRDRVGSAGGGEMAGRGFGGGGGGVGCAR